MNDNETITIVGAVIAIVLIIAVLVGEATTQMYDKEVSERFYKTLVQYAEQYPELGSEIQQMLTNDGIITFRELEEIRRRVDQLEREKIVAEEKQHLREIVDGEEQ